MPAQETKPVPVPLQGVQEIPIKPLVVQLPGERIVERFYHPIERHTDALPVVPPVINIEVPAQAAPHITVNVPERSKDDKSVRGTDAPTHGAPGPEKERGSASTPELPQQAEVPRTLSPVEVGSSAQPEVKAPEGTSPEPPARKPKSLTPDNKKINEPINFSQPEPAPQASSRPKMKHIARTRGRQRKYHQTIALLEDYRDGETDQFARLDEQMQRYYRREYQEYFGRDSKVKANQRLSNRTKAVRTKRDSERRRIAEISRSIQGVPDNGPEALGAEHPA